MGRGVTRYDENFTFVSSVIKYVLFIPNFIFWVISLGMVAIGIYARVLKNGGTAFAVDPAAMVLVAGLVMCFITFCGCVGALRENAYLLYTFSVSLTIVFLIQTMAGIVGFSFPQKTIGKVSEHINKAIVYYRDDRDVQNIIDFGQEKLGCCGGLMYTDWSQNMYFNCSNSNPSSERCSVPFSCCINPKEKGVVRNTLCGQGMQKLNYIEAGSHIYTTGCIERITDWLYTNKFLLAGVSLGLALPQLIGIFMSHHMMEQVKDQMELQKLNLKQKNKRWH